MIIIPTHHTAGSHYLIPPTLLYPVILLNTDYGAGTLAIVFSFHPHIRCTRQVFRSFSFTKEECKTQRLSRLAGVTQLNGRVRIRAQLSLVPKPVLFLSVSVSLSVLRKGPGGRGSIIGGREVEDVACTHKAPTEARAAMAHSWPKGVGCSGMAQRLECALPSPRSH